MKKLFVCSVILLIVTGCASTSGVHPDSLFHAEGSYFYFDKEFKSRSYNVKNLFGRVGPAYDALCKGKYESWRRDKKGTFFKWPTSCTLYKNGGIWVPDDASKEGFQIWVANVKPGNLPANAGVLIE